MLSKEKREEIFRELTELKVALHKVSQSGDAIENFDDYVEHHEFEIALHCACDQLLDSGISVRDETVDLVSRLHRLMGLDDDCVGRLSVDSGACE